MDNRLYSKGQLLSMGACTGCAACAEACSAVNASDDGELSGLYRQDPAQELDLEHCRRSGLPVFRREVGGGAVYLDRHQLFWQVGLRRDHPLVSLNREASYRRFLAPVVAAWTP